MNASLAFAEEAKSAALSPAVIEQMDVANKLIALGDARKDPLLLIVAAKERRRGSGQRADAECGY